MSDLHFITLGALLTWSVVVVVAARLGGAGAEALTPGAAVFFWARLASWPVYVAGVPYLRTLLWVTSVFGLLWIAIAGW